MYKETINPASLSFGDLLSLVESSPQKLPTVKQLRESSEEILFAEKVLDADITVYRNGRILYKSGGCATVETVRRCASPTYIFIAGQDEQEGEARVIGCNGSIIRNKRGTWLRSSIPEETFKNDPWYAPIMVVCEAKLNHNQEAREESHEEFHFDDEESEWDPALLYPSIEEQLGLTDENPMTEDEMRHLALERAKSKWTDKQREAIELYHGREMSDKQVGANMSEPCSQQMANRHRHAAYQKVREEYEKIKAEQQP